LYDVLFFVIAPFCLYSPALYRFSSGVRQHEKKGFFFKKKILYIFAGNKQVYIDIYFASLYPGIARRSVSPMPRRRQKKKERKRRQQMSDAGEKEKKETRLLYFNYKYPSCVGCV
jgi:hypothetical protein